MRLYSGTTNQFIVDSTQNQIADKLKLSFYNYYRYYPSVGEVNSWRNSLRAMSLVFIGAGLQNTDNGLILEYQLPLTSKRLDCLICGCDSLQRDNAVIIELKQWDKCTPSDSPNEVFTWVGGNNREILHPSVQVGQYKDYLSDSHTAFYEGENPILLSSCAYLHNYSYSTDDPLLDDKFVKTIMDNPLFSADCVPKLTSFLKSKVDNGNGLAVLNKIENSKYRPSKKLMEHVGNVIKGKSQYTLLDEQLVIYDKVFTCAKAGFHDKQKTVLIVKGGPGTGKSVIAINLMSDILLNGYNAHYATGSKAFTETLKNIIGARGSTQFKFFSSYMEAESNEIDVLIADESHRLWAKYVNRFQKVTEKNSIPPIVGMLNAAKIIVFFIDDKQIVRPNEIGSVQYIKDFAQKHNCKIYEFELEAQFRCNGSDAFVNWVDNTLSISRNANIIWEKGEGFDFQIFDSPVALEEAIRQKTKDGNSARITAGFCWEWSKNPNADGTLLDDVIIGNFRRPWNAQPTATRLAKNIPKASLWANDPNGINQVGCVYTAQGFEFDYVGVIIGKDLIYNLDKQLWEGNKKESFDSVVKRSGDKFLELIKNTYRVLLTRGIKGCYVYIMDKDTERFIKTRIEDSKQETTANGIAS